MEHYQACYREIIQLKNHIDRFIKSGNLGGLYNCLYDNLTSNAYHYYRGTVDDMTSAVSDWSKRYPVVAQGYNVAFKNDSIEAARKKIVDDKIGFAYFHVTLNSECHINRRIVLNTTQQTSAIHLADHLIRMPERISVFIKKIKVYLTNRFEDTMKDDKIVIYYNAEKPSDKPPYFDKTGKAILRHLKEVPNHSDLFFPFHSSKTRMEGTAFGDEPADSSQSFSSVRCAAMARTFMDFGFPKNAEALKAMLEEPFGRNNINPDIPYLNIVHSLKSASPSSSED